MLLASVQLLRLFREHRDEFSPDNLALLLRVRDAFEFVQEPLRRIQADDAKFQAVTQHFERICKLVLPQHPGVHENICQPVSHCPVHQNRRHRRVHAAAEPADRPLIAHLLANRRRGFFNECRPTPLRLRLAHLEEKIPQQLGSALRMVYFGMELHRINLALRIFHRRDRIFRMRDRAKSLGERPHVITVAVPHPQ